MHFLDAMFKLLFSLFLLWVLGSVVFWSIRNGISPMPTSPKVKKALLDAIPKDIKGTIYELGSGWGTLAIPLADQFSQCQVIGLETSPVPFLIAKGWQAIRRSKNLRIVRQDFYKTPLNDASLVVCYLYPGAMKILRGKFESELKPGVTVISNTFSILGWKPEAVIEVNDIYRTKLYVYKMHPC